MGTLRTAFPSLHIPLKVEIQMDLNGRKAMKSSFLADPCVFNMVLPSPTLSPLKTCIL